MFQRVSRAPSLRGRSPSTLQYLGFLILTTLCRTTKFCMVTHTREGCVFKGQLPHCILHKCIVRFCSDRAEFLVCCCYAVTLRFTVHLTSAMFTTSSSVAKLHQQLVCLGFSSLSSALSTNNNSLPFTALCILHNKRLAFLHVLTILTSICTWVYGFQPGFFLSRKTWIAVASVSP